MRKWFSTISFWLCVVLVLVNYALLFISKTLHDVEAIKLNLLCMVLAIVGAINCWYMDKKSS
jgi:uncharacterized membrane protein YhaH (DUF805 family)